MASRAWSRSRTRAEEGQSQGTLTLSSTPKATATNRLTCEWQTEAHPEMRGLARTPSEKKLQPVGLAELQIPDY